MFLIADKQLHISKIQEGMKNSQNTDSFPKKVIPRDFKRNTNIRVQKKRAISINLVSPSNKVVRSITRNTNEKEDRQNNHQSKAIQTETNQTRNVSRVKEQVDKIVINLPSTSTKQNSRLVTLPQLSNSSNQFDLQDYEKEFLLKMRARAFVAKIKNEEKEGKKKLEEMRERERKNKERELKEQQEKRRMSQEADKEERRQRANKRLRQCLFNQQRRKEEAIIRKQQQEKKKRSIEHQSPSPDRKQLDNYLHERSQKVNRKKREEKRQILQRSVPEVSHDHMSKTNSNPDKHHHPKNNKNRLSKKLSCKTRNTVKGASQTDFSDNLENHLYLTAEDEQLLDRIKTNMIQLQSLQIQ